MSSKTSSKRHPKSQMMGRKRQEVQEAWVKCLFAWCVKLIASKAPRDDYQWWLPSRGQAATLGRGCIFWPYGIKERAALLAARYIPEVRQVQQWPSDTAHCGVTPRKIATALPRLEFPTGLHCFPHCPNIMVNWLSVGIAGGTKEYYKVFIKTPSEFKFPSINFELHIPLEIEFREKELILSVYTN